MLRLDNVSVSFPLYHGGSRSLKKSLMFRGSAGRIAQDVNQRVVVEALRNISLKLESGDRLALVGSNGAGKTTLLRVMAKIYEPIDGAITTRGRVSPMFDIGLGVDVDMSGYENIRMRGLLLGMSSKAMDERITEIAEFTELGDYLEMPVRTYSSGMMMRLTFAVATCIKPEILIMDEWILAGDVHFMHKAEKRIASFVSEASIVVLASHNLAVCREWCNKAAWLEKGAIVSFGPAADVIDAYEHAVAKQEQGVA